MKCPFAPRGIPTITVLSGLIVLAFLFAVSRFFQPDHPFDPTAIYKDFAHLFVGALMGATLLAIYACLPSVDKNDIHTAGFVVGALALFLIVVEGLAFAKASGFFGGGLP